jgi:hypothetical protein
MGQGPIAVHAVTPTFVYTAGTAPILDEPKTRAALLGEIIYLASAAGGMVIGTILAVDGGWTSQ